MKKKNAIKKIGFTLLEMLIAVVIISTLVAISVPMYNKVVYRAEATEALSMLSDLSKAQNMYFMNYNAYTDDLRKLDIQFDSDEEDNEDFISTPKFTYYAGILDDERYCVYSESNNHNYTLAKNYKDNSEIICSGKDCSKVKAFAAEGSISEMCNGSFGNGICDLSCGEGSKLDKEKCSCEKNCKIEESECTNQNPNYYLANPLTTTCFCKCNTSTQLNPLLKTCSCGCPNADTTCESGYYFNKTICSCVQK